MRNYLPAILLALLPDAAVAGDEPPLVLRASSSVETGWTSNATESAIGAADLFVTHTERLEISGEADGFALRGGLEFSETRFATQDFENDASVGFDLAVGQQVSETLVLRGSLVVAVASLGDDLNVGVYVATRTPKLVAEASGEAVYAADGQELRLAVTLATIQPGESTFPGLDAAPLKLSAGVSTLTTILAGKQVLTPQALMLATAALRLTGVDPDDRLLYGRLPVHALRLSGGMEAAPSGRVAVAAEAGLELLWSPDIVGETPVAPYLNAGVQAALTDALSLAVNAGTGVELADPVDGVAATTQQASATLAFAATDTVTLTGSAALVAEQGIAIAELTREKVVLAAGFEQRLGDHFTYGVTVGGTRYRALVDSYDKLQVSITASGRI